MIMEMEEIRMNIKTHEGEIHCTCGYLFKYGIQDIKKIRFIYSKVIKSIVVCPKCNRITYLD
jgi:hypothetical protein